MQGIRYCPLCRMRLNNALSEVSHFRAHVRKNEMVEIPPVGFEDRAFTMPESSYKFTNDIKVDRLFPDETFDESFARSQRKFYVRAKRPFPV